jgi:hypothetical protein
VNKAYQSRLAERAARLVRRHGLEPQARRTARGVPGDDDASWPEGAIPAPRVPADGAASATDGDQLRLL